MLASLLGHTIGVVDGVHRAVASAVAMEQSRVASENPEATGYGRSPVAAILPALRELQRATRYKLRPINGKLLAISGCVEVGLTSGWVHSFFTRHKGLRQWLRWHFA